MQWISTRYMPRFTTFAVLLSLLALPCLALANHAICPFCSAISMTFWEQIKSHDVVVIAKLVELPPPVTSIDAELPKAEFEVTRVLRGVGHLEPESRFRVLIVGDYPLGQEFVVMGVNPPGFIWSTPLKATPRIVQYVETLGTLPESGPERLLYFQKYFEDEENLLALDAYDEFARAPYADLIAIKQQMDHDQLIKWLLNPDTTTNRRRLYFTMLGVCGGPNDIPVLEKLIRSEDRKDHAGLDALVACYLNLAGVNGMPLVEDTFLKNEEVDFTDTLATISALRFHGTEMSVIPKERLVAAVRTLLDRPKMADMIIPDLARWQDWSVMEKLVQLFKDAKGETMWVRVPVIQYLQVCPKPEAKKYIEELRQIDPDAVARAALFNEIDFDNSSPDSNPSGGADSGSDKSTQEKSNSDQSESNPGLDAQETSQNRLEPLPAVESQPLTEPTSVIVQRVPFEVETSANGPGHSPEPSSSTNVEIDDEVPSGPSAEDSTLTSLPLPSVDNRSLGIGPLPGADGRQNGSENGISFLLFPFGGGALLFALLWSVMHGWFERLIF